MTRILRLLHYMRPYVLYSLISVALMAVYAAMAGFRVMLIKPIVDNVLAPTATPDQLLNFEIPLFHCHINLQPIFPHQLQNAWAIVAVALIGSAIVKSVCDYLGTLLANRAGSA
jgi:subfamily B ATP-binding cassette protein MsbA